MSNLTVSVDDALIRRARIKAIEQGTSVSAKVREFLIHYVEDSAPASTECAVLPPALPVFGGQGGLQPGITPGSNRALLQAADK